MTNIIKHIPPTLTPFQRQKRNNNYFITKKEWRSTQLCINSLSTAPRSQFSQSETHFQLKLYINNLDIFMDCKKIFMNHNQNFFKYI